MALLIPLADAPAGLVTDVPGLELNAPRFPFMPVMFESYELDSAKPHKQGISATRKVARSQSTLVSSRAKPMSTKLACARGRAGAGPRTY